MATNFGATLPSLVALAFRKGLEDRNVDGRVISGDDSAITSCENLLNFGPAGLLGTCWTEVYFAHLCICVENTPEK